MKVRRTAVAALGTLWIGVALDAGQASLTRDEAESMAGKLALIEARSFTPTPPDREPARTSFSDREVNAYFRYIAHDQLPAGLVDPQIGIQGGGRVSLRAWVDLDAVRESTPRGPLDPMAYVSGMMETRIEGALTTAQGMGTFTLGSATLGGVTVPRTLVLELVAYFTRTAEDPDGVNLSEPFVLPAGIRDVTTVRGIATVVQ